MKNDDELMREEWDEHILTYIHRIDKPKGVAQRAARIDQPALRFAITSQVQRALVSKTELPSKIIRRHDAKFHLLWLASIIAVRLSRIVLCPHELRLAYPHTKRIPSSDNPHGTFQDRLTVRRTMPW
jgi:hypothetical protein